MNRFFKVIALFFALVFLSPNMGLAQSRAQLWKKVEQAKSKSLPKTAIEYLEPIYEMALKEKDMTDAAKALCEKIVMEGRVQGNKPEEKILRLEEVIYETDTSIQPLLRIVLASWYWEFYRQNRYRFINRSHTEGVDDTDIATWDLPKLFAHIGNLYENVLNQEDQLKKLPISELEGFINFGDQPKDLRPTLFDFFAHEALGFYMADDQSTAKPVRAFEVEADSPALGSLKEFLAWQPEAFDKDSCNFRAVVLLQRILKHASNTSNQDSMLDNDLIRLAWARQVAVGQNVSERYMSQLENYALEQANHPFSSRALGKLAKELLDLNKRVKALNIAERGMRSHPGTYGAKVCESIKATILQKSLTAETEKVLTPSGSELRVSYKNIDQAHFRLISRSKNLLFQKRSHSPDRLNWDDYPMIITRKPAYEWSATLDPGSEYLDQSSVVAMPEVEPGLYYLAVSYRKDFDISANSLSLSPVIVSELGLLMRRIEGATEVFAINNTTGSPVERANIVWKSYDYNDGWQNEYTDRTDKDGKAVFSKAGSHRNGFFTAEYKGHYVYYNHNILSDTATPHSAGTRLFFFTDRSIYRPGQTIYFKAIVASYNTEKNDYLAIPSKFVHIQFKDPNHQVVKSETFTSNKFGSISGSFIAPDDRLTGQYSISAENLGSSTAVRVEEYKRPQFKVDIQKPETGFSLNQTVEIAGEALAYTGAKIDGAMVKYRVVREVQFPPWCWWFIPVGSSQEIAHGTTVTDTDGKFKIKFEAAPDRSVEKSTEPVFSYTIHAVVTDSTGETRSAQQKIRIGYTALALGLDAPDTSAADKEFDLAITTKTLDGTGVAGSGKLVIYALKQPRQPARSPYFSGQDIRQNDKSQIRTWDTGKVVFQQDFNTSITGGTKVGINLPEGAYRIEANSHDRYNNSVKSVRDLMLVDTDAGRKNPHITSHKDFVIKNSTGGNFNIKVPFLFYAEQTTLQPGDTYKAFWATGYDAGPAFVEVEHQRNIIQAFWTKPGAKRHNLEIPITEAMRGGFYVRITQVKENRDYTLNQKVNVPWNNKNLKLHFAHMTSKLEPGQKDTWTVKISGDEAEAGAIEMLAAMYDASLDAFASHSWADRFNFFYNDSSRFRSSFTNHRISINNFSSTLHHPVRVPSRTYPSMPRYLVNDFMYQNVHFSSKGIRPSIARSPMMLSESLQSADSFDGNMLMAKSAPSMEMESALMEDSTSGGSSEPEADIDLDQVSSRQNLQETAFFEPHLLMNKDGSVSIEFTIPEALTTWKFLGFAHGTTAQAGGLIGETITQKDLMVQPNPPRFLREADIIRFTARVTNLSNTEQKGQVRLQLMDPVSEQLRNSEFKLKKDTLDFVIPAGESRGYSWELNVPYTPGVVKYKIVGGTDKLSDGEEGMIPILSSRIFVTESMPLPIIGPERKKFEFTKLVNSAKSDSLEHQGLTVEVTSNPAWYAVQALPYLMEFPHECSEQVFNRLYANCIASFIARSDPKIRRVFDTWKAEAAQGSKALYSNLEKNEHLKSVALLETPWVLDAKNETQQKHRLGVLFDKHRLEKESNRAISKLKDMQLSNGAFPWFPGGKENSYITLYIMTGFGRMRALGIDVDLSLALRAVDYLDKWIVEDVYERITNKGENYLSSTIAMFLYGRSFFLKEKPIPSSSKVAIDYFLNQARDNWTKLSYRKSQGHLALALHQFGDKSVPMDIVRSIKEHSVTDEELGRFWRENEISFWWYRAEIETQALMIEMFDRVANDQTAVEECKVWLLKQKQTQNWKTTKATADAIYALLLRGADLLASDKIVRVALGGKEIKPEKVEAGTGYYQKIYSGAEVKPSMGLIEMIKEDKGVAWGAVHWQYLEDMSKVTPHETNLKLKKTLFIKENTDRGPVIKPVKGELKPGDLMVVRIELRVDRDMEYIHMKDQRGSGLEPTNVISSYRYQDGLAYYEATKDTATHFYIDYLPKGTYVFEYDLRVQHQGVYQSGIAEIQCMYAPEFNSHSESFVIRVNE